MVSPGMMNLKAASTAESAKFDESLYVIVLPRDEAEQIPAQFVTKSSSLRIVKIDLVSITYWGGGTRVTESFPSIYPALTPPWRHFPSSIQELAQYMQHGRVYY